MIRNVIQYQTKPDGTERNAELIRNVFRELSAADPGNVRYAVLQSGDTFTHIVSYASENDNGVLTSLAAFKAFQEGGAACRATKPEFLEDVTVVGNYGMLAE